MQQRIAKALGEDVVNHTPNKYSLPHFAEFVKTERKILIMNAYKCDLCGELFVHHGEFRIARPAPAGMYYTLFKNNAGNVVDICDHCRCRLQDVLDTIRYEREQAEREE